MLQILGTLLVRLSACLLVLRMPPVGHTKQLHTRAIYMLMAFFIFISTASFFLLCFECIPIEGLWDQSLNASCIPKESWTTIQKVDGSKSMSTRGDLCLRFVLTKTSLRNCHELFDCQSPINFSTEPSDSSKRKVGSHDYCLLSLWVS